MQRRVCGRCGEGGGRYRGGGVVSAGEGVWQVQGVCADLLLRLSCACLKSSSEWASSCCSCL